MIIKNNVEIVINSRSVYIVRSSCTNKICIKTGKKNKVGDIIVCAPNKVIVKIVSQKKENIDGLAY